MRGTRRQFLAIAALSAIACASPAPEPAPIVGRPAPDFTLPALDGSSMQLGGLRGKPVVVNFFATWCGPCRFELPTFQALADKEAGRGLTFLLVDLQEDAASVRAFLEELKVNLPTVLDETGEVTKLYRVRGLPATYFVGRDGYIHAVQLGVLDERLLVAGIEKII